MNLLFGVELHERMQLFVFIQSLGRTLLLNRQRLFFFNYLFYCILFLIYYYHVVLFAIGVYAWIGINFVLGRFDHVHSGMCRGNFLISFCHKKAYVILDYKTICYLYVKKIF